ncbi:SGNH/GDSL hydrolase family protein [Modestobacter versicolor]|uniref:Lysophospholipase L1-like esterase n=1 Tax=Modestobacter versicolor TaxID=429133 RepID=A0A323VDS9_9ACTN|nr:SGNH/GDSL hydrolase family protein [Modestobacter versicolor]MBB3676962.1 lysophospholipase L1-like esterase [Modestobacter versicolor]PZA22877.1 hypothetical protein DMO24_02760 [Modestobacter versicolor]
MARMGKRDWTSGPGGAPWWALGVILVGVALLAFLYPMATGRLQDPLPEAERARLAAAAAPSPSEEAGAAPAVAAFIGDSYTVGAGTEAPEQSFTARVAAHEGWREANLGRGGTGYVTALEGDVAQAACSLDRCPTYTEMIDDAVAVAPDVVVVSGGRNEVDVADDADYADGVAAFFRTLREQLPAARIIAISPLWSDGAPPDELALVAEAVRVGVTGAGGSYLDVGQPLQEHPEWVIDDGIHPDPTGHAAIADAVNARLDALPPTTP